MATVPSGLPILIYNVVRFPSRGRLETVIGKSPNVLIHIRSGVAHALMMPCPVSNVFTYTQWSERYYGVALPPSGLIT